MMRRSVLGACVIVASVASVALINVPTSLSAAEQVGGSSSPAAMETDPLIAAIRQRLTQPVRGSAERAEQDALMAFYADRDSPLWVSDGAFTAPAHAALSEIAKADDWGLSSAAFDRPPAPAAGATPTAVADAEVKVWLAVLKYARYARGGRIDPSQISSNLDQKPNLLDPKIVIASIATSSEPDSYLRSLHPKHPQFERLRQVLLKARGSSEEPATADNSAIKLPDGPSLKPGARHADIVLLRRRLEVAAQADGEDLYDHKLEAAVKAFQREHGLTANGIITDRTRSALNGKPKVAGGAEVQRIIVNMERWRWMPENLGEFYVWDNVPEYMTHLIKNGEVIHSAKIVVGKVDTPTAIFSAEMKHIIFHPEWGVPDSIKVKEILPYLRPTSSGLFGLFGGGTDTRILERHNLKVSYNGRPVDASQIDWSRVDIRQYTFIQPGGGSNVLGAVKFRFPNKYDIYMHDTPERQLFGGSTRAFSHGCMRVQDPGRFAEVLLAEDKGWSAAHVQHLMTEGYNNEVELSHPIPVHVTYFTEIVGDDGTVKHFGDPYGYDGRVSQALLGKPLSPSKDAETASDSSATGVREIRRVKARNSTGDGASHDPFSGLFGN